MRKRNKADVKEKARINLLFIGILAATIANILLSFVLISTSYGQYTEVLVPSSFLLFLVPVTIAITKHELFDVRLAITRLIGYTITIGLVSVFYSSIVLLLSTGFTSFSNFNEKDLIVLLVPTIFVGFTFQRVESFISKHTQRIFYHDAYNLREVLDQLSDSLLREGDIDEMMKQSLKVINDALKPTLSYLAVLNTSGVIYKHISEGFQDNPTEIMALLNRASDEKDILIERLDVPNKAIAEIMAKDDIDILLRLGPRKNPTGLLLLGPKKSGTDYSVQDVSLLRISAKNLGIALDNTKKYEQILHFADTLHKEVKRATSRLKKANIELKTLDALKDDFIATASHQLRTPSASVHDALRMLNQPGLTKKDKDELIALAEASSEHLVTVVRTMLNMARIQAGHFTIDKSEVGIIGLTEKVLDQVKVLAEEKGSKIDFYKPNHSIVIQVDVAKINEALTNYIENAVKYSPEKSVIKVSILEVAERLYFEVEDQGIGVPEEEKKNLFSKFYRASNARQEQPDGNGIGLYVVKCIAEGHGGEAYYHVSENGGSVFGFWIPYVHPNVAHKAVPSAA